MESSDTNNYIDGGTIDLLMGERYAVVGSH